MVQWLEKMTNIINLKIEKVVKYIFVMCKERDKVHTHLFDPKEEINNNENVRLYNENSEKKIY